ncbi:hypothetical protein HL658_31200 [Azospirillum sp. RWY-5-1]|uniref:Uncharacterized protein n=1 Tax=Azospirillum oleiclasticum TaxID=2735135 RepID=A0ABX2TJJ7_9PROT|nr:hypothetical protein [Azospirillum oleiclasticum]NYZ17032.1 hypothetical protein [Azospirillum oleiclasticum]NYZ24524.1 hypothetical protein [Azospirillum oleiclasticum]
MTGPTDSPLCVTAPRPFALGAPITVAGGRTGTVLCIGNTGPRRQRLTVRLGAETVTVHAHITGGGAPSVTAVQPEHALRAAQGVLGGSPVPDGDIRHLAAAYLDLLGKEGSRS